MNPIILKKGAYEVLFVPEKGMNFISLKKEGKEVIDQTTLSLFEERMAGLGAMIGPHFHHRAKEAITPADPALFPHVALLQKKGILEPFSHGIGRYAPWTIQKNTEDTLVATLKGMDQWKGIFLKDLEGQDFVMNYAVNLRDNGLHLTLSVDSEKDSMVGLHTYYSVDKSSHVLSDVEPYYRTQDSLKQIPNEWFKKEKLNFDLTQSCDYGFFPTPQKNKGSICLLNELYSLYIEFESTQTCSWQLWHPENTSFACIEPLSVNNPKQPKTSSSKLEILISIDYCKTNFVKE